MWLWPPCAKTRRWTRRKGPTITGPQQLQIQKLGIEVGVEMSRMLDYFSVPSLKDLPASEFARVVRSLENRRAA